MTTAQKMSYALIAVLFGFIAYLHVGHIILAGLFSFMFLDITYRLVEKKFKGFFIKVLILSAFFVLLAVISVAFVKFLSQMFFTLPDIAQASLPRIIELADKYGLSLPFGNFEELRDLVNNKLMINLITITRTSTIFTREAFHMVIMVIVAALFFISRSKREPQKNLFEALRTEINIRIRIFMISFEKVLGAQFVISAINTCLTGIFLYAMGIPHAAFLTSMTFIIGLMPIIGNIITNTIICITALSVSLHHAIFALAFLIIIHKSEYFLNSKIMGSSINMPMWQTLLAILIGNILMGISGIMLAPAMLHYIKSELQAIPLPER